MADTQTVDTGPGEAGSGASDSGTNGSGANEKQPKSVRVVRTVVVSHCQLLGPGL